MNPKNHLKNVTKSLLYLAVFVVLLHSFAALSLAAMPAYSSLQSITANLASPSSVAIDGSENIYIVDATLGKKLNIYNRYGNYLRSLTGLTQPGSVAVDGNGFIYVGNESTGSVDVYRQNLSLSHKLGSGDGEFGMPGAIAVSDAGMIYVADVSGNTINVYNSDGSYAFSFGAYGSGNGQFTKPGGIAIDETAGELIISDLQVIQDANGTYQGARVQVFDLNGIFTRTFGQYGQGEGKMLRPKGVAADGQGRIYVADTAQNVVQVFDNTGIYLGAVYDLGNPMRTPLGIAYSASNKLYVVSLIGSRLDVFGIDAYSEMAVSPLSLTFEGQELAVNPALQSINITNNGTSILNWTASSNEGWITLSAVSGSAEPGITSLLDVNIDLTGLTAGTYTGSVEVTSTDTGVTDVVDVSLTVLPAPPVLEVTPPSLDFLSEQQVTPPAQTLSVNNTGGDVLDWTASADSAWIILDKNAGTAPDTISVSVNISGLVEGIYAGSVAVTGAGTTVTIPVTLGIFIYEGTINVTTNLADAAFIINGPASYAGSGTSWSVSGAPMGTYVIVYGDVNGYLTPPSETLTLQDSGTITFSGLYEAVIKPPVRGDIITGAGPDANNTALVRIFNYDASQVLTEFTANAYKYGVNVAAGDLDGDGEYEVITGAGPGSDNPAEVGVFDSAGNKMSGITAFTYKYGVNVASGDIDGDGKYELITGAGTGSRNPAAVKVYVYDSSTASLVDSGIVLNAYSNLRYGVRVAAGDVDGDGKSEIITAPGAGKDNKGIIKIWKVETEAGAGYWRASLYKEFTAIYSQKYSVSVAGGDINGDGIDEIITGAGPHKSALDQVKIYNASGQLISEFTTGVSALGYGVNVVAGDIDGDGIADIIAGAGPGSMNIGKVKVLDAYGAQKGSFTALDTRFGVNVAAGVPGN